METNEELNQRIAEQQQTINDLVSRLVRLEGSQAPNVMRMVKPETLNLIHSDSCCQKPDPTAQETTEEPTE